jgi:hypothetical protein
MCSHRRRELGEIAGFRRVSLFSHVIEGALQEAVFQRMMAPTSRFRPLARWRRLKEHRTAKHILLLALVGVDVGAATQFGVLQPFECTECPSQLAQFTPRERQAVLPRVGREFADVPCHAQCPLVGEPRF